MVILGIESSCDETAASLIEISGRKLNPHPRVLSNIVSSQVKIHARYGGVVPEIAARKHAEVIIPVISKILKAKSSKLKAIDVIAVTSGPGLITSLRVGVDAAKTLACVWKKPLVPVNHIEGHIYSNWLTADKKLTIYNLQPTTSINFPALVLVVSGGHTELVLMKDHGKYRIIGQTLDDAAGEAFDKVAKILGLGYPGGPVLSALADRFQVLGFRPQVLLPRPMIESPNYNFSFSGLKTAVLYKFRELEKSCENQPIMKCCGRNISCHHRTGARVLIASLAYEFQNAAVEVLVVKTVRAAKEFKVKTVMLAGGVSANKKLRLTLEKAVSVISGVQYVQPSLEYTTDNAAMIAMAGYFNYIRNPQKFKEGWRNIKVNPNLNITRTVKR